MPYYDRDKFKPELAEDMNVGDMSATFKLKKNATFHDGTPVTAKDVKWSLDRAVSRRRLPDLPDEARARSTKPEQFVVVDDHTVRVDFLRKDRLTVPDLAVIVPCVLNSELVKKHATEKDPWGLEYTKQNTAGGGAYRVASWTPAPRSSSSATTNGRAGRCRRCGASSGAWCRPPATGARCSSAATPTSPTTCRTRISSS